MQTLLEIKDAEYPNDESTLRNREAVRAVLFDENGLTPLLFVAKYNYHKLPGGGVDDGESRMDALAREVKEETGCKCAVTGEVGQIFEFRSQFKLKQMSYCYLGKIVSKSEPEFTKEESGQGFEIIWLTLDEAIIKIENDKPQNYEGGFIQKRDLIFLKETKKLLTI